MACLGQYRLLVELGHRGMADVFLGCAESTIAAGFTKLAVIKRMRNALDDSNVAMFLDEARLAARLNHPNVVQTNEVGEADGSYYMTMEFLDGQSIDRVMRKLRTDHANDESFRAMLLYVLSEALAGIHYAHDLKDYDGSPLNIVHRDFTPQNLFVTYEGQVKVLDFGIAKASHRDAQTADGVIKGKLRFMAPEQASAGTVDRRVDVFAAGVMLWEAVAAKRFWGTADDIQIFGELLGGTYATEVEGAPDAMNAILRRALAREPSARYATAQEMRQDLLSEIRRNHSLDDLRERLAAFVQELFGESREKLHRLVEQQVARFQNGSASDGSFALPPNPDSVARAPRDVTPTLSRQLPGTDLDLATASPPSGTGHIAAGIEVTKKRASSTRLARWLPVLSIAVGTSMAIGAVVFAKDRARHRDEPSLQPVTNTEASVQATSPAANALIVDASLEDLPDVTAASTARLRGPPLVPGGQRGTVRGPITAPTHTASAALAAPSAGTVLLSPSMTPDRGGQRPRKTIDKDYVPEP